MIPGLINHLWQSTLFAAIVGLLTLSLRKNEARVRYGLWLAASCKFLIPFAPLVSMGSRVAWRTAAAAADSLVPIVMTRSVEPVPVSAPMQPVARNLPWESLALAIWLCGAIGVVCYWLIRWRRLRMALRGAVPLAIEAPIPVLGSRELREPGVLGIFRPALFLPDGIADRLAPNELQAILAHEVCHARRRDNLTAALHMAVEAVFWFHPLVWWLGARLLAERERACDEAVLQSADPETYAGGILKVCRLYLESPLACAAGVTGANLRQRVEAILSHRAAQPLGTVKKLLLVASCAATVAMPIGIGLLHAPPLRAQAQAGSRLAFEVASVKENKSEDFRGAGVQYLPGGRLVIRNFPLNLIVINAYDLYFQSQRLTGGPDWIRREKFDIDATAEKGAISDNASVKVRNEKLRLMLQTLLADRFQMRIRRETREQPVYVVTVAKGGPKLQKAAIEEKDCAENPTDPNDPAACHRFNGGQGRGLHANAVNMSDLAGGVEGFADRPVIDKTELSGLFNIQTEGWVPMRPRAPRPPGQEPTAEDLAFADPARPTIFQIFDRLGLKLESDRAPVEMFVIEGAEHPTGN